MKATTADHSETPDHGMVHADVDALPTLADARARKLGHTPEPFHDARARPPAPEGGASCSATRACPHPHTPLATLIGPGGPVGIPFVVWCWLRHRWPVMGL